MRLKAGKRSHRETNGNSPFTDAESLAMPAKTDRFDSGSVDTYWRWAKHGCPMPPNCPEALKHMAEAAMTTDAARLGMLAGSRYAWVRFAAAGNPVCPPWAVWGDGNGEWGLVEDQNRWVRSIAVLSMPYPPAAILESVAALA